MKQMVPKKVTDFFFGKREISIVERISSRWRTWVIYDMDGREKNLMCREGFSYKEVPGLLKYYEDYIEDGTLVNSDKWLQTWNLSKYLHDPIFGRKNFTH